MEFIIGLAKSPEEAELRKGRFASQFQGVGGSGVEISPENEMRREEDKLSEM